MAQGKKIKIRRGLAANRPAGGTEEGELRFDLDTKQLWIDDGTDNVPVGVPGNGAWYQQLAPDGWSDPAGSIVPDTIATPQGSVNRAGPITPTLSASVEDRDGAWWVCEGTVNLLYPLTVSGSPVGMSITSDPIYGLPSAYVKQVGSPSTWVGLSAGSHTFGSPTTVQVAWDLIPISNLSGRQYAMQVRWVVDPNSRTYKAITAGAVASYRDVVVVPAGSGQMAYLLELNSKADGDEYYVARPQVEIQPYPTPFVDGTRVDGLITIPHATRPEHILIRTRMDDGTIRTDAVQLDGSDEAWFGVNNVGYLAWDGSDLTVTFTASNIGYARQFNLLGVAIYNDPLPTEAVQGLRYSPLYWSMGSMLPGPVPTPLPATVPNYENNAQIGAGGTTVRSAPGGSADTVISLSATDEIHDTGQRVTSSGTPYAYIAYQGITGWVDASYVV